MDKFDFALPVTPCAVTPEALCVFNGLEGCLLFNEVLCVCVCVLFLPEEYMKTRVKKMRQGFEMGEPSF